MSDLVREISRLLHRAEHEEYTDDPVDWGRIGALNEVVEYKKQVYECVECEDHVCECDCDEDKLGWSQREEVRNAISILEGLL